MKRYDIRWLDKSMFDDRALNMRTLLTRKWQNPLTIQRLKTEAHLSSTMSLMRLSRFVETTPLHVSTWGFHNSVCMQIFISNDANGRKEVVWYPEQRV